MSAYEQLRTIITPSWLETVISIIAAVVVATLFVWPTVYGSTDLQTYFEYVTVHPTGVYEDYQTIQSNVNQSKLAADSSVFIVWAVTGIVGYVFVSSLMRAANNIRQFNNELGYARTNKKAIVRSATYHIFVRLLSVAVLYIILRVVILYIVPLFLAIYTSSSLLVLRVAVAILITLVFIHIVTIILRLITLKTRVFLS